MLCQRLSTPADFSIASVEEAWAQAGSPESWSLVVGINSVSDSRRIETKLPKGLVRVWVNTEWTEEWMLSCGNHLSIFSEGA